MKYMVSVLLVLLAVTAGCGGSSTPDADELCSPEIIISSADSNGTIGLTLSKNVLYVRPFPDFHGVSLTVEASDGEKYVAWFPKDDACFQGDVDWWQILAATWPYSYTSNDIYHSGLYIRMWTDRCPNLCYRTVNVTKVVGFTITGHGSSAWRRTAPDTRCTTVNIRNTKELDGVPCKEWESQATSSPSITTTTTTPPATTTTTRSATTTRHTTTTTTRPKTTTTTRPKTTTTTRPKTTTTTRPTTTTTTRPTTTTTTRPATTTRRTTTTTTRPKTTTTRRPTTTTTTRPATTTRRTTTTTPRPKTTTTTARPAITTQPTTPTPAVTPSRPFCTESSPPSMGVMIGVVVVLAMVVVVLAVVVVCLVRRVMEDKELQLVGKTSNMYELSSLGKIRPLSITSRN